MKLLLVRHGQTASNVIRALDTLVPGPGLTNLGQEQAAAVAAEFGASAATSVYASTMLRARQTAAPTADRLGLAVSVRDGLREIGAGELEMRADEDAIGRYRAFLSGCAAGQDVSLRGGETSGEVITRFDQVVGEILGSGVEVAIAVSHGAMIRAWTGLRADNLGAAFVMDNPLRNTGTVVLEATSAGWAALTWDAIPLDGFGVSPGPTGEAID